MNIIKRFILLLMVGICGVAMMPAQNTNPK